MDIEPAGLIVHPQLPRDPRRLIRFVIAQILFLPCLAAWFLVLWFASNSLAVAVVGGFFLAVLTSISLTWLVYLLGRAVIRRMFSNLGE